MGKNRLLLLMPGNRRNNLKLSNPPRSFNEDSNAAGVAPKHIQLPRLPLENELVFEGQTLLLFVICSATQYLNLYRTVWWLPQSHTNSFMNFHLIDLNVVQFCTMFVARPFVLNVLNFITPVLPHLFQAPYMHFSVFSVIILCTYGHIRCAFNIYMRHGMSGISCISYPIVIYMLMYCPNLFNVYEEAKTMKTQAALLYGIKTLYTRLFVGNKFSFPYPVHVCSNNPEAIREEVDKLKGYFNERLKYILFKSLLIAYYSSFVPICFAQSTLYYDVTWTAQHVAISWLSSFLLLTSYLYSPQFYDILHKSALHLGKWLKLEARNSLVPCSPWMDHLIYGNGVVVKHSKEYFKSEGLTNCAEPGNQSHLRYYVVFSNPVSGFGTLLALLFMLIIALMYLLFRSTEWFKLVSISALVLINTLTVFRLVRSYYILKQIYAVESQLQASHQ